MNDQEHQCLAESEIAQQRDWEKTMVRLSKIIVKGDNWPKGGSVSWRTLPPLIRTLCEYELIPTQFISTGQHWDPFYLNGKVLQVYKELGFSIRQRNENFWEVWPEVLKPNTFIITNPPFGAGLQYFLMAFFEFLITFDRPFVIILPNRVCIRQYFEAIFSRIRRPKELHLWGLGKSFPMRNETTGKTTGFSGLTIAAYYKPDWDFVLDQSKFKYIFIKKILHFQ